MQSYKIISEYIATQPKDAQKILKQFRATLKKLVPKGKETVSYGMPTIDLDGKHFLHFAGFKKHIGFYPTPSGVSAFKKELEGKYIYSKGAIQFPIDKPLPWSLITKIVRFRIGEQKRRK